VTKPLGRGKYSEVYLGMDTRTDKKVVIKILKPVRNSKILREIKILKELRGCQNIIEMVEYCNIKKQNVKVLVFEYIAETNFKQVCRNLGDLELRFYMYELLKALDVCHSNGIMHRDVKPMNIVVNLETKELRLIDWGLSDFYLPGFDYNVRVASRPYKGPELTLGFKKYDYSLDIWSTGCTLAAIVSVTPKLYV
jgi:casein kinase II subunit alpha